MPFITVFTPTYNRAYTLKRLFDSLLSQSCYDFEWILVDDESDDDTSELVQSFKNNRFAIIYHRQAHGGKHRAFNWAVKHANGKIFFTVDSDDYLLGDAIQNIKRCSLKVINKENICGVAGLKILPSGEILGGEPNIGNNECIEASNLERKKYNLEGDKAEAYKTDILKLYPFPEFPGEDFMSESVVWNKIALEGYKLYWYSIPVQVCEYLEDGLTKNGANKRKGHLKNLFGYAEYVSSIMECGTLIQRIVHFIEFDECCHIKNIYQKNRANMINMPENQYTKWKVLTYTFRPILPVASFLYHLFR